MKHFSCLSRIILLSLVVSCTHVRENDLAQDAPGAEPEQTGTLTFTAYIDPGSKTQFGEEWSVLWSEGDQIRVYNDAHPEGIPFSLVRGAGTSPGTFSGPAPGSGPFRAVYPADRAAQGNGTSIPVSFPATQTYAEGTKALLVNQNKHMAMECIAQLYHLGISNIEFYPFYPQGAGLSTAITAAAVIGGSYFGDNLSMISGTVGLTREYGGIEWFVTKIRAKIRNRRSAEYGIGLLSGVLLIATIATIQLGLLRTPTGTGQIA